jgi:hypothetical protein
MPLFIHDSSRWSEVLKSGMVTTWEEPIALEKTGAVVSPLFLVSPPRSFTLLMSLEKKLRRIINFDVSIPRPPTKLRDTFTTTLTVTSSTLVRIVVLVLCYTPSVLSHESCKSYFLGKLLTILRPFQEQ